MTKDQLQEQMSELTKSKCVFAIPPGVHLLDFGGPAQVFYEAMDEGAPYSLHFASIVTGRYTASSSCGIHFSELVHFNDLSLNEGDMIFLPGLEFHLLENEAFLIEATGFIEWVRAQHQNGVIICSICTGAFLLAETGLLAGKECTTHWKYLHKFAKRYGDIKVLSNRLFVDSDNLLSSAGVASGIDLALYLLEKRHGSRFASRIAREIVIYFRREPDDPQLSIFLQYRNHLNDRVHATQEWMIHHFHEKFTVERLAEQVNTSPRHLTRLFKETTGITIGQYLEKLRIEHAVQLLKGNNKVEMIAGECGFQSANQLRQLFKKHIGVVPSSYKMSVS